MTEQYKKFVIDALGERDGLAFISLEQSEKEPLTEDGSREGQTLVIRSM